MKPGIQNFGKKQPQIPRKTKAPEESLSPSLLRSKPSSCLVSGDSLTPKTREDKAENGEDKAEQGGEGRYLHILGIGEFLF